MISIVLVVASEISVIPHPIFLSLFLSFELFLCRHIFISHQCHGLKNASEVRPQHANARAAENKMSSALESSSIEGEDGVGEDRIGETVELISPSSSSGREKNRTHPKKRIESSSTPSPTRLHPRYTCRATRTFSTYDKIVSFAARVVSTWEPDSRSIGENT